MFAIGIVLIIIGMIVVRVSFGNVPGTVTIIGGFTLCVASLIVLAWRTLP